MARSAGTSSRVAVRAARSAIAPLRRPFSLVTAPRAQRNLFRRVFSAEALISTTAARLWGNRIPKVLKKGSHHYSFPQFGAFVVCSAFCSAAARRARELLDACLQHLVVERRSERRERSRSQRRKREWRRGLGRRDEPGRGKYELRRRELRRRARRSVELGRLGKRRSFERRIGEWRFGEHQRRIVERQRRLRERGRIQRWNDDQRWR